MAYKKLYRKKRVYKPKRKMGGKKLVSTIKRVIKKSAEHKRAMVQLNYANITTAGQMLCWTNSVAQGVGENQRIANKIQACSLHIKTPTIQTGSGINILSTAGTIRLITFIAKAQPNATFPTVAEVLDSSVISNLIYAPYNNENMGSKFSVLADKIMVRDTDKSEQPWNQYFRLRQHITYNSATATDTLCGHVYTLFLPAVNLGTTPNAQFYATFGYVDV